MPEVVRTVRETPRQRKARIIGRIRELAGKYPVIMFADFGGMPSSDFQRLRKLLAGRAKIMVAKKRIARVALSEMDRPGMDRLLDAIPGQLAIIFTEEPPGRIFRVVSNFHAEVPIKPGQEAQEDVVIPAGPTDLPPGPALSDLKALDIPTKIQGGKIAVTKRITILKKGEKASQQVADVLKLLGIRPIRVSLRVTGALDGTGLFYSPEILAIGPEEVSKWISQAAASALRLAVEAAFVTPETVGLLLALARARASALAGAAGFNKT